MDYDKLIERLWRRARTKKPFIAQGEIWTGGMVKDELCADAATALSTLQAENAQLRAELEQKEKYYAQMVDALAATDSAELAETKRKLEAAEARAEKAEKALSKLQSILYDPLIIEDNGVLRPVKRTSRQDVYKAVLTAQKAAGITGRWFPTWMKEE